MLTDKFAVMILCHGRPENTPTYFSLRKYGYTGRIIIVCDDEDNTVPDYQYIFGKENVEIFSKDEVAQYMDAMDNTGDRRCAVYARNACFDIAEKEGLEYFAEFDDDYTSIPYRWEEDGVLYRSTLAALDDVFRAYIEFMETSEDIYSVAFGQPGDFIGGVGSRLHQKKVRRKCMNSWICKTSRRFTFNGRMNDDVNGYTLLGHKGMLFLTFDFIMIDQPETQQVDGGMTDMYLGAGTYQKSFYSVMLNPSFMGVTMMGDRYYRIHHSIDYEYAYPEVISWRYSHYQTTEIWKDIDGYEGIYQVSTLGEVKSLERTYWHGNRWYHQKEKILKQDITTNGYLSVMLYKDGKSKRRNVHRLVAETFMPNPDNLPEVNHCDEDKTNNDLKNLEWCTTVYNAN